GGAGGGRGRGAGRGAWVFPAKPGVPTGWTETPRLLPFGLRGDAEDLPVLRDLTEASRDAFTAACSARELAEERRLAYVAVTRAAYWGACCRQWWGGGAWPRGPPALPGNGRAGRARWRTGRRPRTRTRRTRRWPTLPSCPGPRSPTPRGRWPSGRRPRWWNAS